LRGIEIYFSDNVNLTANKLFDLEIVISNQDAESWTSLEMDDSNTVNGRPIIFWRDKIDGTVPTGAYQIYLINCTNVRITDQNITTSYYKSTNLGFGIIIGLSNNIIIEGNIMDSNNHGVYLYKSHNNVIKNNYFSNNSYAIDLKFSENNTITDNEILDNFVGVQFEKSNYNQILKNNISNGTSSISITGSYHILIQNNMISNHKWPINIGDSTNCTFDNNDVFLTERGIELSNSDDNSISNNTFYKNEDIVIELEFSKSNKIHHNTFFLNYGYCIWLNSESKNNIIFNNNFFSNIQAAHDYSAVCRWNDFYPIGGNFWSDYSGYDNFSGEFQNNPGSDGFGDTPYNNIHSRFRSTDQFPLMRPVPILTRLDLPPVHPDNFSVDAGDGFCTLKWNPPEFKGGSKITHYRIYRRSKYHSIDIIANIKTINESDGYIFIDTNLTNGHEYFYSILATNDHGDGPNSTEVSAIPHETLEKTPKNQDKPPKFELTLSQMFLIIIVILAILIILLNLATRKGKKSQKRSEANEDEKKDVKPNQ
jgi:parallel beta-helix repeat protein